MSKKLSLIFSNGIKDVQPLNSSFAKAIVAIAYTGVNRNNSEIKENVFTEALPSIKNIPIVGCYKEDIENFEEHSAKTVPFGVVAESCSQWWEIVTEDDGTQNKYLFTECFLWKRQKGFNAIVENKKFSQSMEINILDYSVHENGICEINKMEFEALCILGEDYEPCFESAYIQLQDEEKNDFKLQFSKMLSELKEFTEEKNGGENMDGENTPIVEPVVEPTEPIVEPISEPVIKDEPVATADDSYILTYKLSHDDIRCKLYDLLYKKCEKDDGEKKKYSWITRVYDDYFIFETEDGEVYKQEYLKNDTEVVFNNEAEKVFAEYLTSSEKSKIDEMRNSFNTFKLENEELKAYKQSVEKSILDNNKNEIFSKWSSTIGDIETFITLKENMDNYSLEEIEKECKCIFADAKATFSAKPQKENNVIKIPISTTPQSEDAYGGIFAKYGISKEKTN